MSYKGKLTQEQISTLRQLVTGIHPASKIKPPPKKHKEEAYSSTRADRKRPWWELFV